MVSLPLPFERPAPDADGARSAFSLLPEEIAARGFGGDPTHLFARLQRPTLWEGGAPSLGRRARAFLAEQADLSLPRLVRLYPSSDGATRCVLETRDGHLFEAVHMPRSVRNPRVTLCLSSQIGCAMGCTFCATGIMGIVRNLDAGEIVAQVLVLLSALGPREPHRVNLVFMGMGEPLHNVEQVERALKVLCHPAGLGLAASRITVSTSGLVPGIQRLARAEPRPLLAVSINATTDEARAAIMPVNRKYPLSALKEALLAWPVRRKERITLEYVLLAGENDTEEDARRLAAFARGLPSHVNLIPMNEHKESGLRRPEEARVSRFAEVLMEEGCLVLVRNSRGRDVAAACGQLVTSSRRPSRRLHQGAL